MKFVTDDGITYIYVSTIVQGNDIYVLGYPIIGRLQKFNYRSVTFEEA